MVHFNAEEAGRLHTGVKRHIQMCSGTRCGLNTSTQSAFFWDVGYSYQKEVQEYG